MTAMMSAPTGSNFFPSAAPGRGGILLNASPCSSAPSSPRRTPYQLLAPSLSVSQHTSLSSHSSASSSTSSTDDFASTASSASASAAGPVSSNTSASSSAHPHGVHGARKIRFAPLPEPRRDAYDDDLSLLPSTSTYNVEIDSAQSSPLYTGAHLNAFPFLSPPAPPRVIPPTPPHPAAFGHSISHALSSCSTLGLSLDGSASLPDSEQATETGTIAGSDCATDDTHTLANTKRRVWTRLLRLPKAAGPLRPAAHARTPDENAGGFNLWRSSSRESTASAYSLRGGSLSDTNATNASSASLGGPLSRRQSTGAADCASLPSSPVFSFRGGLSLRPIVSEAGTAASPAAPKKKSAAAGATGGAQHSSASAPPTVRRGMRLLNGRVYGSRLAEDPFASARDTEPEFVEWGHGGMGSVRGASASGAASAYAALQSSRKLSVGHVADTKEGAPPPGEEDDGSGMGWVRRRREQRERERREKEREEKEGRGEAKRDAETEERATAAGTEEIERAVPAPAPASETAADEGVETALVGAEDGSSTPAAEAAEPEHVYTAVTVPAPKPKVHHHHSHSSAGHSGVNTPAGEHAPFAAAAAVESPPAAPSPLAEPVAAGADSGTSTPNSAGSVSSDDEEEESVEKHEEGEEEEEEEEEEEAEGVQADTRKTAIGAGVEKVSRHKD
ncbi:hypothetical protein DFH11DRAFT_1039045 [Phellopilus nigrolimitatus]|nr:hypothetical protein DFH11DRAFT_1039045 [Phellopilus nigrolimitatus]